MATHNATIDRKGNTTTLKLSLPNGDQSIVLTEDNPHEVKATFNKLLEQLKDGEFDFKLTDDKEDLYFHICQEYIRQLNAELKSTYNELKDNGLLKGNKPT